MKDYLELFNAIRNDWLAVEGLLHPHQRLGVLSQFMSRQTVQDKVKKLGELYRGLTKQEQETVRWLK